MRSRLVAPVAVSAAALALALSACSPVAPHDLHSPTPSGSSLAAPYVPSTEAPTESPAASPTPTDTVAPPAPSVSDPSSTHSTAESASPSASASDEPQLGDGSPQATLEGSTLTLTTWGSSTCPVNVVSHQVSGAEIVLTAAPQPKQPCTMDLAPHTQKIALDAEPAASVKTAILTQRGVVDRTITIQR